jgi:hypothetical protein
MYVLTKRHIRYMSGISFGFGVVFGIIMTLMAGAL